MPQTTLKDVGIEKYLESTKDKHDGLGYDDFKSMIEKGVNTSNLARIFKVDRKTAARWVAVYEQEVLDER